jgi:hypothetical protein
VVQSAVAGVNPYCFQRDDFFREKVVVTLFFLNFGPWRVDFSESMILAMQKALKLLN